MAKESAYIKDERTGKFVINPEYKKTTVAEAPVVKETTAPVAEEVVASAEEAANENVTTEAPAKKTRAKKK